MAVELIHQHKLKYCADWRLVSIKLKTIFLKWSWISALFFLWLFQAGQLDLVQLLLTCKLLVKPNKKRFKLHVCSGYLHNNLLLIPRLNGEANLVYVIAIKYLDTFNTFLNFWYNLKIIFDT